MMPGSRAKLEKGTTFVEMMVSLAIITVMIGLVTGALANYLRVTAASRNTVEIVGKHERVLRKIREDLYQSSSNRSSGKQWWIEDDGKTLRLCKLVAFCIDDKGIPELEWSSEIVYTLDSGGFATRAQDGPPVRIADKVTKLQFAQAANGRVRIELANEAGDLTRNTQSTLATTIEVTPQN